MNNIFNNAEDAAKSIQHWHEYSDTIVFTNGCFDILHAGHVIYLEEAKALGDRLVVGLNTDASVREIKGDDRPIIGELNRAKVLVSLESVDMVILFDEETPIELIKKIKPQYLVKGGDYREEDMIGADFVTQHNGKVMILSFVDGISTSGIIDKIKSTS